MAGETVEYADPWTLASSHMRFAENGQIYDFSALATDGTSGQVPTTDGSGNITWASGGGGTGDVVGPASSTDGDVVLFDGTTGKLIKDAGFTGASVYRAGGTDVAVADGGTNISSYAQGDLLYASASTTLSKLAKDTNATRYLSNQGTSNNPSWNQVNLANGVTGTLPVANGGTNKSSWNNYRYVRTDGSGAITENAVLTDTRVPYSTTNGLLTDDADFTFDGSTLAVVGTNGSPCAQFTHSGTSGGSTALIGAQTGATGLNYGVKGSTGSGTTLAAGVYGVNDNGVTLGVMGENTSTSTGAAAVYGLNSATTGQVFGGVFDTKSTNAASYGLVAQNSSGGSGFGAKISNGLVVADLTSGRVTYATTNGKLTDNSGLTFNGTTLNATALTVNGATVGQNTYLTPCAGGLTDSAAGTRTITSGSTFCVYVGKAPASFTSCTIYYDVTTAPTLVSAGTIGLCKGTAPDQGNATLTYLGSANITGGSDTGLGIHKKAVTVSGVNPGDDLWACISWTSTGAGVLHACLPDLLQIGAGQSAASVFSAAGGWSSQATTTDGATASVLLKVRVLW